MTREEVRGAPRVIPILTEYHRRQLEADRAIRRELALQLSVGAIGVCLVVLLALLVQS